MRIAFYVMDVLLPMVLLVQYRFVPLLFAAVLCPKKHRGHEHASFLHSDRDRTQRRYLYLQVLEACRLASADCEQVVRSFILDDSHCSHLGAQKISYFSQESQSSKQ